MLNNNMAGTREARLRNDDPLSGQLRARPCVCVSAVEDGHLFALFLTLCDALSTRAITYLVIQATVQPYAICPLLSRFFFCLRQQCSANAQQIEDALG